MRLVDLVVQEGRHCRHRPLFVAARLQAPLAQTGTFVARIAGTSWEPSTTSSRRAVSHRLRIRPRLCPRVGHRQNDQASGVKASGVIAGMRGETEKTNTREKSVPERRGTGVGGTASPAGARGRADVKALTVSAASAATETVATTDEKTTVNVNEERSDRGILRTSLTAIRSAAGGNSRTADTPIQTT